MTEAYYALKFTTYEGKTASIHVPKAVLVSNTVVRDAMTKILESEAISVSAGLLKEIDGAEFIETETVDCDI